MSSRICQVSVRMLLATGHRKDCLKLSPAGLYNNVYYLTENISEVGYTPGVMWQCPWSSPILIWFCQVLVSCSDWQRGSCQWPTSLEFRGTCDTITFLLFFFQEEVTLSQLLLSRRPRVSWLGHRPEMQNYILHTLHANCIDIEGSSEKAMAPPSSTLAWKIPWTEEPGGLQSMGSLRVRHDWATSLSLFTFMHWRRQWQPTPVFLPGKSHGLRSLVGFRLWGHTELDTTEVT